MKFYEWFLKNDWYLISYLILFTENRPQTLLWKLKNALLMYKNVFPLDIPMSDYSFELVH